MEVIVILAVVLAVVVVAAAIWVANVHAKEARAAEVRDRRSVGECLGNAELLVDLTTSAWAALPPDKLDEAARETGVVLRSHR